jgi:hypothetical protein
VLPVLASRDGYQNSIGDVKAFLAIGSGRGLPRRLLEPFYLAGQAFPQGYAGRKPEDVYQMNYLLLNMLVGLITETDLLRAIVDILGYTETGTRITFQAPDSPQILLDVAETLHDFQIDLRSLATWALAEPAGHRGFVIRVRGEEVDRLLRVLHARYGEGVGAQAV